MKKIMRHSWLVIIGLGIVIVSANALFGDGNSNSLDYVNVIVVVLTLAVIANYAYDTYRLADATELHMRPAVSVGVERRLFDRRSKDSDPETIFYIKNDSRFQIEVKVHMVLQYGQHIASHSDSYYSGQTVWNIGPQESYNGNFKIFPFFDNIGDSREIMMEKLKANEPTLKIFLFSEYRIFEDAGSTYTRNMTKSYWLKPVEVPQYDNMNPGGPVPLPYVWVYEFKSPPGDVIRFAENGK